LSSRVAADSNGRRPRYRRHQLTLPDGGKLRLGVDGTIKRLDADGTTVQAWLPGDPEWAGQAIRFGLRPEPLTVAPHSQRIVDARLP